MVQASSQSSYYISADGSVGGSKSFWKQITDFFAGIFSLISLFFTTITNPKAIEANSRSSNRTYAQRQGGRSYRGGSNGNRLGRGSNIRGIRDVGNANCQVGGG